MDPNNQDPKEPKDPMDPIDPKDPQDGKFSEDFQEPFEPSQEPRSYGDPTEPNPEVPSPEAPKPEASEPEASSAGKHAADSSEAPKPEEPQPFPSNPDTPWDSAAASGKYDSWGRPLNEDWDKEEDTNFQEPNSYPGASYPGGGFSDHGYPGSYPGSGYPRSSWDQQAHPSGHGFNNQAPQQLAEEPQKIPNFSIFDAFGTAWRTFSRSPLPWLGFGAVYLIITFVITLALLVPTIMMISANMDDPTIVNEDPALTGGQFSLIMAVSLLSAIIGILFNAMMYRAAVAAMRGKTLQFTDIFTFKDIHFLGLLGLQILTFFAVLLGLVLLIVPGVLIAICTTVAAAHYYLRPERGPFQAFKAALQTGARNPLAILLITIALAILGGIGGATVILLPLILPLTIMVSLYLAMLSLHERPAFMDETEDPFGTNYPTHY